MKYYWWTDEKAAEIAQALDFINEKEDKFNSEISQGGSNVSGGQKQRLSIARALAKNPKILLFDDSFSALDYKTDVKLRKTLREEMSWGDYYYSCSAYSNNFKCR